MDLYVHFWDVENNCVTTCYYNSKFVGKAAALNMYETFEIFLAQLGRKLSQVSSDGPSIMASLDLLNENRTDNELTRFINIGACDLYATHSSMKHDQRSSGWKINKLSRLMNHQYFKSIMKSLHLLKSLLIIHFSFDQTSGYKMNKSCRNMA